ncbi:MAG: ADP-heptose--LPS heptosyltransferase [Francisellaceae bacterium]|nr:ADP-heptose--LPS heptosyltransferase [Francisellaceae bacterium]
MRVLIIKMSSLGDIIHSLPALTDAHTANPSIRFDWLVEPAFQDIPKWHKAVENIIITPLRSIKKNKWQALKNGQLTGLYRDLKIHKYDMVIDAQGLFKSAILGLIVPTKIVGFDWHSAREPLASLFYNTKINVSKNQHAIFRTRELFSKALNYPLPQYLPDYGLNKGLLTNYFNYENYVVFLHGTTWDNKQWPTKYWIKLGQLLNDNKIKICLLWGNEAELQKAEYIKNQLTNGVVLPKLNIKEIASLLLHARTVVTVDTGLGHLAAALHLPLIAIFGPTDPNKSGILGHNQINLQTNNLPCIPCLKRTCYYKGPRKAEPPCMGEVLPDEIFKLCMKTKEPNFTPK